MDATTALAIYRAEKDKALRERRVSHVQLMAEAQEAFRKMLADAQLARKGGRPKGSTSAPAAVAPAVAAKPPIKVVKSPEPPVDKVVEQDKPKAGDKAKPARLGVSRAKAPAKKAAPKRSTEKRRAAAKPARATARSRGTKGSAKKAAPRRKQAAARERKATARKR